MFQCENCRETFSRPSDRCPHCGIKFSGTRNIKRFFPTKSEAERASNRSEFFESVVVGGFYVVAIGLALTLLAWVGYKLYIIRVSLIPFLKALSWVALALVVLWLVSLSILKAKTEIDWFNWRWRARKLWARLKLRGREPDRVLWQDNCESGAVRVSIHYDGHRWELLLSVGSWTRLIPAPDEAAAIRAADHLKRAFSSWWSIEPRKLLSNLESDLVDLLWQKD